MMNAWHKRPQPPNRNLSENSYRKHCAVTKEQIGGFYLIEAPTIEADLDWASRVSEAIGEPIEVRPLVDSRGR